MKYRPAEPAQAASVAAADVEADCNIPEDRCALRKAVYRYSKEKE